MTAFRVAGAALVLVGLIGMGSVLPNSPPWQGQVAAVALVVGAVVLLTSVAVTGP